MSQKKVNKYKSNKANRKKNMKRQKKISFLQLFFVGIICFAMIAWIPLSVYQNMNSNKKKQAKTDTTNESNVQTEIGPENTIDLSEEGTDSDTENDENLEEDVTDITSTKIQNIDLSEITESTVGHVAEEETEFVPAGEGTPEMDGETPILEEENTETETETEKETEENQ